MIPFNFVYLKPQTLREAARTFAAFARKGQEAIYYGGGSEIITMCRAGAIRPDAVIDIKGIPQCHVLAMEGGQLLIGAAVTLTQIASSKLFKPMTLACGRIADHTNQCRITLCGNLCGSIIYRETALPLLLCDADVVLQSAKGLRTVPFNSVFDGQMRLAPGEMLAWVCIPEWALNTDCWHIKKTTNEKIDYPLITVAAIKKDGRLRAAFSGFEGGPIRSLEVDAVLNDKGVSSDKRAQKAAELLAPNGQDNERGSLAYRLFVLERTLTGILEEASHDAV